MSRAGRFASGLLAGSLLTSVALILRNEHKMGEHLLAQRELIEYEGLVELGMPVSAAKALFESKPTSRLTLLETPDLLYVDTPDFLARNWVLKLEVAGGRVAAIRYRTPDGPKPPGSPADRSTPAQ